MKKQGKRTLTPKLRFPEFRDNEGWREVTVRETAAVIAGQSPRGEYYNDIGNGTPFYQGKTDFGDVFINPPTKWTTQVTKLAFENDILISVRAPVGALNINTQKICIGRGLAALRAKENKWFLYYLLLQVNRLFVGNGGSVFDSISKSQIESTQIPFPQTLLEQQKIAECLSSLDGLIAAERRKLAALRDHKRGLMQQLFPQPGQTQPRLRFPEFRDNGEWSVCQLGPLTTKVGSGITPMGGAENYKTEGRPFVRSQNVGWGELILDDMAFIDEGIHQSFNSTEIKVLDVLLNITGASIGRSAIADSRIAGGNVNQHVCIIRVKRDELNPTLLNQFLISERGQKQIDSFQAGGNRQGLNFAQIRSFEIPLPPTENEQHKIANCLSSLDDLITAQSRKLDALRTHKRGLMQQLFPTPEGQE